MLPTIAWRGRSVVMIDQRKLPALETYVRCRTYIQVAQAIEKMVVRGAPAIGIAAAYGLVLGAMGMGAATGRSFDREFEKVYKRLERTRPTARNLFWALERMRAVYERTRTEGAAGHPRGPARRGQGHRARGRRDEPGHRPPRPGPPPRRLDRADALQRRGAGHGRLRHRARDRPGGGRRGQVDPRLRRRDPAVPPGGPADRLGARPGRHPGRPHHRQHGRLVHAPRRDPGGRRRGRPHRPQRRHGQQDRDLLGGRPGQGERRAVLRRGPDDRRSTSPSPTAAGSPSRSAIRTRSARSAASS